MEVICHGQDIIADEGSPKTIKTTISLRTEGIFDQYKFHEEITRNVIQGVCKIFFKYMTLVYLFKNKLGPPPSPLLLN
jgi:hypothetical protein